MPLNAQSEARKKRHMAGYIKIQFVKEIDGEDAIHIRDRAFQAMPFVVDAQFPEAITVGDYAFTMCNTLTTLDFPKVEEILGLEKDLQNMAAVTVKWVLFRK